MTNKRKETDSLGVVEVPGDQPLDYPGPWKPRQPSKGRRPITVARYVERNALRTELVDRGEETRCSSLFKFKQNGAAGFNFLTQWPMERPQKCIEFVNAPDTASELDDLRSSAQRSRDRLLTKIG
jgi:hypothetical protein